MKPRAALLLTPGAGADRNQASLIAIEQALEPHNIAVERMDFPYRKAGRKAPDRAPVLLAAVIEGAAELAKATGLAPKEIFLGGRSMGGRICSMAMAEGLSAAGLVLVSYPLHPPGKPEKLRTEHLPKIVQPCLFLSGTRDAFGSPAELEEATQMIPGPVTHDWIEGGDHGLRGKDVVVAERVAAWMASQI